LGCRLCGCECRGADAAGAAPGGAGAAGAGGTGDAGADAGHRDAPSPSSLRVLRSDSHPRCRGCCGCRGCPLHHAAIDAPREGLSRGSAHWVPGQGGRSRGRAGAGSSAPSPSCQHGCLGGDIIPTPIANHSTQVTQRVPPRSARSRRSHPPPSTSTSRSCGKKPRPPARPRRKPAAPCRTGRPTGTGTVDSCFIITR